MSFYNMLFGRNSQTDLLLAVVGLRPVDVERLRDCRASEGGAVIEVYTRTGGGNRDGYPNLAMRKRPEWTGSVDDDYDSTYCTDTLAVPEQFRADVAVVDVERHHARLQCREKRLVVLGAVVEQQADLGAVVVGVRDFQLRSHQIRLAGLDREVQVDGISRTTRHDVGEGSTESCLRCNGSVDDLDIGLLREGSTKLALLTRAKAGFVDTRYDWHRYSPLELVVPDTGLELQMTIDQRVLVGGFDTYRSD